MTDPVGIMAGRSVTQALYVLNAAGVSGVIDTPEFKMAVDVVLQFDIGDVVSTALTGVAVDYAPAPPLPENGDESACAAFYQRKDFWDEYGWFAEEEWTEDGAVTFAAGTTPTPARYVPASWRHDVVDKGASLAVEGLLSSLEEQRKHATLAIRAVRVLAQECVDLQPQRGMSTLAQGLETLSSGALDAIFSDAIFSEDKVDRRLRRGFLIGSMRLFMEDPAMHDLDVISAAQRLTARIEVRLIHALQDMKSLA